jgi:CRISPR-associated protein (TIGR02710 family)
MLPPPISAVLVSVGGSPAPVLHVLRQHRPAHVWYFCSAGSRANADAIQAQLDWHPAPRFIEVARFEELGPCCRELRRKLPEILTEARVAPESVLVDYTGGTKTMSAALVLAATELFRQFSYVGGAQREKGGLGITVEGQERVHYQANPWQELALREIERAGVLWAAGQFDGVARLLRELVPRVPQPLRFEALATLADGLAARQRLDFASARTLLRTAQGRLRPMFEGHGSEGPLPWLAAVLNRCERCAEAEAGQEVLAELLDNALRTAEQGRHEDAAARLYRAMELQGQLWLAEVSGGCFRNGRCRAERVPDLPATLRALPFCAPGPDGEIKLSSELCFRALNGFGDDRVATVVADLDRKDAAGKPASRWRAATDKRNASILAHGLQPVGAAGFEQMKRLAAEFLGFDLQRETLPTPPLEAGWFA